MPPPPPPPLMTAYTFAYGGGGMVDNFWNYPMQKKVHLDVYHNFRGLSKFWDNN